MRLLSFWGLLILPLSISSQNIDCQRMMRQAEALSKKKEFQKAINKYTAAATCNPQLQQRVNAKINEVFILVEKEKESAIRNEKEAIKQKARAEDQTKIAIQEKEKAEKETRAANNGSLALRTVKLDQTLALRIAEYNLKQHQDNLAVASIFHDIISNNSYSFYNQLIEEGYNVIGIFSPDGESFLTAGTDNVAKLWSLDGQLITILEGHEKKKVIKSIAFSPDGQSILTGSNDGTAKLWVLNGKAITTPSITFEGHNGGKSFAENDIGLNSLMFSPNGQTILSISLDKTAKLWSLNGELMTVFEEPNEAISLIAYSPNSEMVVTVSGHKTAKLWSLDGKILSIFEDHSEKITAIAFSPNGENLLTGSFDKTAKLWSLTGEILTLFEGHKGDISSVAFSPDGKTILTAGNEHILWSLDGQILANLAHKRSITSFDFSPDSKKIVTGSYDFTAKLWSLDGKLENVFDNVSPITDIAFSPDGKKILTVDFARVKLWSVEQTKTLTQFTISTKCRLSPNREMILAGVGNTAKLWSIDGQIMTTFEGHQGKISQVLFSPNGQTVLTSEDCIAKLWSLNGQVITTFEGHQEKISSIEFSPTGEHILTNSTDKTARLWSLDGKNLKTLAYKNPSIYFTFEKDGKSLLMQINGRKTKKRWSLDGNLLDTFDTIIDNESVIFYPNGKTKLSLVEDKAVLYSMESEVITTFSGHQTMTNVAAFSPDDKMLAIGDMDGFVKLWSIDGKAIMTLPEHQQGISFIEFTTDGKRIVTSDGNTIRVSMTPTCFLEERVYKFSIQQLYKKGVQLEPADLLTLYKESVQLKPSELLILYDQGIQLTPEELNLIRKE